MTFCDCAVPDSRLLTWAWCRRLAFTERDIQLDYLPGTVHIDALGFMEQAQAQ